MAFLDRPLDESMELNRRLVWRWRVDAAVPPTDLSRAPGDDRSLAVHVVFPLDQDRLSFWERVESAVTGMVAPPLAGLVLTYVWGGTQAEGSVVPNPFFDAKGRIIVLRNGAAALGRWTAEDIDFVADFRAAFGYEPPAPSYIAISSDSDDTGSLSRGVIAELEFRR